MKKIRITDRTMTSSAVGGSHTLSFREKLELARLLDRLGVDAVETDRPSGGKKDTLLLKSLATALHSAALAVPVLAGDAEGVDCVWAAVKDASHPRLQVIAPVSAVGLEYSMAVKPNALPAMIETTVAQCRALCPDVEFVAEDAGRCDPGFLEEVVSAAAAGGAGLITFCDSAGSMLPEEVAAAVERLRAQLPDTAALGVSCANTIHLADACTLAAVRAGADVVKACSYGDDIAALDRIVAVLRQRGDSLGLTCSVRVTELGRGLEIIRRMCRTDRSKASPFDCGVREEDGGVFLSLRDDMTAVCEAAAKMGYDLDEEDAGRVYEAFVGIASHKEQVSAKELDAIIASAALQVPPTYELDSFVINSGNVIDAAAHVKLKKAGQTLSGICVGDGPIDAAFLAIEQIVGCHYELDDFQIQAVTEGREAMGQTVVRLRSQGKLYSGRGISTDIIGSSIFAYINALNKIVYEEAGT